MKFALAIFALILGFGISLPVYADATDPAHIMLKLARIANGDETANTKSQRNAKTFISHFDRISDFKSKLISEKKEGEAIIRITRYTISGVYLGGGDEIYCFGTATLTEKITSWAGEAFNEDFSVKLKTEGCNEK
jgi:hypothetical protein